jgi:hypothetical protein
VREGTFFGAFAQWSEILKPIRAGQPLAPDENLKKPISAWKLIRASKAPGINDRINHWAPTHKKAPSRTQRSEEATKNCCKDEELLQKRTDDNYRLLYHTLDILQFQ